MMNKVSIFFFLLMICSIQADPVLSQTGREAGGQSYRTEIRGDINTQLRQALIHISDTVALEDRPLMSMAQLQRRIRDDISEFLGALRSFGYYSPDIVHHIREDEDPMRVVFEINPGPEFKIKEVELINLDPDQEVELPDPRELGLVPGRRIRSAEVLDARRELDRYLRTVGFPFPRSEVQEVIIDHAEHSAAVYLAFDPGPRAVFGKTQVTGLDRVDHEFVLEKIPWGEHDEFQSDKMDELRRKLTATGLFTVVEINHARELENDRLPMEIMVRERAPRTFRAGLGYQSDIGPELRLGWKHRNLWGRGETLEADLSLSDVERALETGYTIPSFMRPDQKLILKAGYVEEDKDAFEATSLKTVAMLERQLTEELSIGAGAGYRLARVEQLDEKIDLGLVFFPGDMLYDSRDDFLNPSKGLRFNIRLIPFVDSMDLDTRFLKTFASLNTYLELWPDKRIILANRVAYGAIGAESKAKVPPDERFYAGGGGSIRGYAYQKVGPLENGDPIGGLALAEINTELRFRTAGRSGVVLFLDGGQVYESSYPDLSERLLWGCGIGYRYYTDFGPIRFDVAFPLDRRKGIDDRFQIYISLGQAF